MEKKIHNYLHLHRERSGMYKTVTLNLLKLFEEQLLGMKNQIPSLKKLKVINSVKIPKIH